MFVVHESLSRERPDVIREIYRMLQESRALVPVSVTDALPPVGLTPTAKPFRWPSTGAGSSIFFRAACPSMTLRPRSRWPGSCIFPGKVLQVPVRSKGLITVRRPPSKRSPGLQQAGPGHYSAEGQGRSLVQHIMLLLLEAPCYRGEKSAGLRRGLEAIDPGPPTSCRGGRIHPVRTGPEGKV